MYIKSSVPFHFNLKTTNFYKSLQPNHQYVCHRNHQVSFLLFLTQTPTTNTPHSKADFLQKILGAEDPVLLDCYAEWCSHCKAIAPKIEEFSKLYPQVKFYQVDVDKVEDVGQELGVRAKPTFMLFKGGEKITEVVGAHVLLIEEAIKTHLL